MTFKVKQPKKPKKPKFEIIPRGQFWLDVDFDKLKSIREIEKLKMKAESNGFTLLKTEQIGFNKFRLIYTK